MPSIPRPLFRQAVPDRDASPEALDQLITLVPVHSWLWLIASASILIALVLWSLFGTLTLTVERAGVLSTRAEHPEAVTYLPMKHATEIGLGMTARVTPFGSSEAITGQVTRIAQSQVTADQAAAVVGTNVFENSPIFEIHIALDTPSVPEGRPCGIVIITGEVRPLSRVLPFAS